MRRRFFFFAVGTDYTTGEHWILQFINAVSKGHIKIKNSNIENRVPPPHDTNDATAVSDTVREVLQLWALEIARSGKQSRILVDMSTGKKPIQ